MIVTFWGVRGSIPVPGPSTLRFGGNTACVSVQIGDRLLVLDAGTGIARLGDALRTGPLAASVREVVLLLSHPHSDHVQGLPFFEPLYHSTHAVHLLDHPGEHGPWSLLQLFDGIHFPLRPDRLGGGVRRVEGDAMEFLADRGWEVERIALSHPGGAFGYRVRSGGATFAHLTDTDLGERGGEFFRRSAEFCRGAALVSHDAQYREVERDWCEGRGHSTVEAVCDLAEAAGVGRMVLFHHDPRRSDEELERTERWAAERLRGAGIACSAAREGTTFEL